ncbi:hypothetical protein LSTR_LSTR016669 [Laodelphax striatellus]|uniref:Uncharacterized protein n=1 Tax=Laodelphax striatellus TaxID=195883 RepID=A0A482X948_LAOST|nr:hypothetical protein LSTR_LSTR013764 [Laodelphax striatellus]RZF42273.1 hypothetical protein LSTR_LSTR016669 [Laodelphax striatellus]
MLKSAARQRSSRSPWEQLTWHRTSLDPLRMRAQSCRADSTLRSASNVHFLILSPSSDCRPSGRGQVVCSSVGYHAIC